MPPRPRRSKEQPSNGQPAAQDSSPSRPQKKRKRGSIQSEDATSSQSTVPNKYPKLEPEAQADRVAEILDLPDRFVQVTRDCSNENLSSADVSGIQAFAKIAGKGWTYYVKTLVTAIGRATEGVVQADTSEDVSHAAELPSNEAENSRIHIDLGPYKLVSRQHADIYFDAEGEGSWYIIVNGRNPIKVDETTVRRGEKFRLTCGRVIEIGHVQMLFILPGENLQIAKKWLRLAGLIAPDGDDQSPDQNPTPEATVPGRAYPGGAGGPSYPTPIAPAPPDYRRAGTPVQRGTAAQYALTPRGGSYANGTMMVASDHLDLSLEMNQHIKPSYSYAQLITQAILDSDQESATLHSIYEHIMKNYAYYRREEGQAGWQNSIRHNLSLSKCFGKIPRSFNEPGKGMKWRILPEYVEDMRNNAKRSGRGGHRGSSAPGSPAVGGHSTQGTREATAGESPGPAERLKRSSRSGSPPLSSYPMNVQHTPDQRSNMPRSGYGRDALPGDGSPLPRHRRQNGSTFGLDGQGSPPGLSSSYLNDEGVNFVTPAQARVHPVLFPPSTAQRPSQHMPTSSPAPFWKYADSYDQQTPMKTPYGGAGIGPDTSPIKGGERSLQSSSPPASRVGETGSPTRSQNPSASLGIKREMVEADDEEEGGIDLTRGFQSISTFHSQANGGTPVGVAVNGRS